MNRIEHQECVLNIRYNLPQKTFNRVILVYEKMPGWIGFGADGKGKTSIPYWYSFNEEEKSIYASMEPAGLHFCANMEVIEWIEWKTKFKKMATEILGCIVGEIEEGEIGHEIEWIKK